MLIFIGLLLSIAHANPKSLEQMFLKKLESARSVQSIEDLQVIFERIQILRLACRLEISRHVVPISCFEALEDEALWRLRTPAETIALQTELTERCHMATQVLILPRSDNSLRSVSQKCRVDILRARQFAKYRDHSAQTWSEN